MKEIPLSAPNLNIGIVENLKECIETGWVSTGGGFIAEFEKKIADYVHVRETVGCQSGTAGLHTALRILGVGEGDAVIIPTLTFIAAVNPVRYQGAEPIFMDCDENLCIDPKKIARFCTEACTFAGGKLRDNATGKHIKAIVPVHIFGNLADIGAIMEIADAYSLVVLEDATEALGSFWNAGKYKGCHAGTVGDIGVFSFNANKIITTGGGGMIVSRNPEHIAKARYLTTTAKDDGLFFVHDDIGYNYRMLNIQAALGVSQIDELDGFIETKKRNFCQYGELLENIPGIHILPFGSNAKSNHWFYSLLIDDCENEQPGGRRDRLMHTLIADGIQCRPAWKLVHTQKPYQTCHAYDIARSEYFEKHILNVPCSTNLAQADVDRVCEKIKSFR